MRILILSFFLGLLASLEEVNNQYLLTMGNAPNCVPANSICKIGKGGIIDNTKQVNCDILKNGERNLKIIIPKIDVNEVFYFNYISTGFLRIEVDYELENELLIGLNNRVIKAGKYPIVETLQAYEIEVTLK